MYRLLILLLFIGMSYAQTKVKEKGRVLPRSELERMNWYYSLEEAMKEPEKVYKLSLQGSKLKEFPMEVLVFKNLQVLNLSENKIKNIPPEIKELKYLQILNLQDNKIREVPGEIGSLRNLKVLYLAHNKIVYFPVEFCSLKQLEYLDVSYNRLSVYEVRYLLKCLPNTKIVY